MFDRSALEQFDDATPRGAEVQGSPIPLRRRKTISKRIRFWLLNAVLGAPGFTIVMTVGAAGARWLLGITQMKLHRLPFPGASILEQYDGFNELDLAHLISGALCIAVTFVWIRVIREAKGNGTVMNGNGAPKLILYLYASVAAVLILADAYLFYAGVATHSGGWGETSAFAPGICTLLYASCAAAFSAFHADYTDSDTV